MMTLPLATAPPPTASTTTSEPQMVLPSGILIPPPPSSSSSRRCTNSYCCPGYRRQRPWTAERIAQIISNVFITVGTLTALTFAVLAVMKEGLEDYIILTIFIVGGTLFGGGCLLALVNVSWLSRRPGVRISAIQVICNVVLILITSYLELLFWPYPTVAYSLLFMAGFPMLILVNLPSCFMKKHYHYSTEEFVEGDTICLDQDAIDDATIVATEDEEDEKNTTTKKQHAQAQVLPHDDTQRTVGLFYDDDIDGNLVMLDLSSMVEDKA